MPNFDKTGPAGKGAKTGAQMGKCEGAEVKSKSFDGRGEGLGRCCGGRRRFQGLGKRLNKQDNKTA